MKRAAEEDEESFRRILEEKDGQLLLEWMDGGTSWVDREHLEGQDALEDWDDREEEGEEIRENLSVVKRKVKQLASWMRGLEEGSRRIVFHLGAGFSAGDGVATFRGVGGLWTKGRGDLTDFKLEDVQPGMAYKCLVALEQAGYVYWVVSQNYDGLAVKAGFDREKLSEIHGNIFVERCANCGKEFYRDFPVEREDADGYDHSTGRACEECGGSLEDVIVHFGEGLRHVSMANAKSKGALISIAIGTKLVVTPAATWVFRPHQKRRDKGKVIIVNLQETVEDENADLVIHHEAAVFMEALCQELKVNL